MLLLTMTIKFHLLYVYRRKKMEKLKNINKKYIHIGIIVLGIIFIFLSAFHENIWFDESYSVAIAKHNFGDIWNITGKDVHPPLYYWMLHIVWMIFGNNVIVFRLFSVLAIAILGILGYTHIRKDFGENVGFLFSFLTYFLPVMCTYSQEIRMYSWSCLIVTLLAIYGYRLYKNIKDKKELKVQNKNLIIFGIFSIAACYIHYYALASAGLINFFLLIYLIKNRKDNTKILRNFIILAIIQIILYIPWLLYLKGQVAHVEGGFWISLGLSTLIEVPSFQFRRQLDSDFSFNTNTIISLIAALAMYIYVVYRIYKAKKEKDEMKPGILSVILYILVIIAVLIISLLMKQSILFARYLLVITGIYIFALAFFMAKEKRKWITVLICTIIIILGCISNITNIMINYDDSNMKQIEYLKENIKPDDIIIYSNIGNGGVIAAFFPDNKQYFYNGDYWDVEEAYKAYGPGMETIYNYEDILKDYHGRIWLIDSENLDLYNEIPKEGIKDIIEQKEFETKYQNYVYTIVLLEKE